MESTFKMKNVYFAQFFRFLIFFLCYKHGRVIFTRGFGVPVDYEELEVLRREIDSNIQSGETSRALEQLSSLEKKHSTLKLGYNFPSFYNLKGVALFESNRVEEALQSLLQAINHYPEDTRAFINLASILPQFSEESAEVYYAIERLTKSRNIEFALKNIDWRGIEEATNKQQQNLITCIERREENECDLLTNGISFMLLPPNHLRHYIQLKNNFSDLLFSSTPCLPTITLARASPTLLDSPKHDKSRVLRIGFLLTRIDSGPVIDLSHIFFKRLKQYEQSHHIITIAFFLNQHLITSDYQKDILNYFHSTYSLLNLTLNESINILKQEKIDVLIEMNGWNTNTGFLIMKERPAKILISYLGDPITTGTYFIDYQISDKVTTPPDNIDGINTIFTESLALLPTSYLVNSYLQWQKNNKLLQPIIMNDRRIAYYPRLSKKTFIQKLLQLQPLDVSPNSNLDYDQKRRLLDLLRTKNNPSLKSIYFLGSFHNWNKITPIIFHTWMNILRTLPNTHFIMMKGRNITNLVLQTSYYGINYYNRFHLLPHITSKNDEEHYYYKSCIDIYLDTIYRNGHVTSLDAQFIGIPIINVNGLSSRMSSRSTESILYHTTSMKKTHYDDYGIVSSVKEYEDLVIQFIKSSKGRRRLSLWRDSNMKNRKSNLLFNTDFFTKEYIYLMQSMIGLDELEVYNRKPEKGIFSDLRDKRRMQLFSTFH